MNSELSQITALFARLHASNFDTDAPLKWGFFFVDSDREKLHSLLARLQPEDYALESIERPNEAASWTLLVSKSGILTPENLHSLNLAFNNLAATCEVDLYEGWKVEKITLF